MFTVFTRLPGESYRRRFRSLLFTCVTYFEHRLTPLFVDSKFSQICFLAVLKNSTRVIKDKVVI